jgi:hypothetical protein
VLWSTSCFNNGGSINTFGFLGKPKIPSFYKLEFPTNFSSLDNLTFAFGIVGDPGIPFIIPKNEVYSFIFRISFSKTNSYDVITPAASKYSNRFDHDKLWLSIRKT